MLQHDSGLASRQRATLAGADCDIRFDKLARQLYATDASLYQVEPMAVAFPTTAESLVSAMRAAAEAGIPITPRGAGTGLAGGAIGTGLVIDLARHRRGITSFNPDKRTVRVESGVVLDQLNAFLKPHGFCFGPDVATSSRATLGGMIGNNSSGARTPLYGTTVDHVVGLEVVMSDGTETVFSRDEAAQAAHSELIARIDALTGPNEQRIRDFFGEELVKRWPGYPLDDWLRRPGDLARLVCGSEGTLVAVTAAELSVVPLPTRKALALLYFDSLSEAMQASVELLDLEPAAVEHIDDVLFDQTRGQLAFRAARGLMRLDEEPCKSILIVEFYDEIEDKLAAIEELRLGQRTQILTDSAEMDLVWGVRKAGLSLLTGCAGSAKPTEGIEDVAVRPRDLPAYVEGLRGIIEKRGLSASYYGHAASGLLHVRPVLDLHTPEGRRLFRELGNEVFALVKQFKGAITAEHGVGMARTEYMEDQLGPELVAVMRGIKEAFDPEGRMNPGKIIPHADFPWRYDAPMRLDTRDQLTLNFEPVLKFAAKDKSFVGNLEQCNGCGGCRKDAPTMCPTFLATGEEIMSTRGRANTIRAVLEGRLDGALDSAELDAALSNCLSCKACTTECPSNVNMALLKAELMHAQHKANGIPLAHRVIGSADWLGWLGTLSPGLANRTLRSRWLRKRMEKVLGISQKRELPPYAKQRFGKWFGKHRGGANATRGTVYLWDDTFVRYHEPNIGKAAVKVLEAAGYRVELLSGRVCCGRPAFSTGMLDRAKALGTRNVAAASAVDAPIIFLEPSCYSMFVEDYRELGIEGAETVADHCFLFEHFIEGLLATTPDALHFAPGYHWVAIHNHCHAKSLTNMAVSAKLANRLPNAEVTPLNTGCCGMAGSFGMKSDKYDLSLKVAKPLVAQINELTAGTTVVASGTSCRHQIEQLTPARAVHMAELLAEALA